jgi:hypothetical protein
VLRISGTCKAFFKRIGKTGPKFLDQYNKIKILEFLYDQTQHTTLPEFLELARSFVIIQKWFPGFLKGALFFVTIRNSIPRSSGA